MHLSPDKERIALGRSHVTAPPWPLSVSTRSVSLTDQTHHTDADITLPNPAAIASVFDKGDQKPMIRLPVWLALPCALMLSGCGIGYFADRATNPIINANLSNGFTTLSMNAGRRTVLVQLQPPGGVPPRVCAEAPPDALEAYANAAALAARGAGPSGGSLGGEFSRSFGTSSAPLLYRTQGLQMIRDLQFTLCVMRLNDTITNDEYLSTLKSIIPEAISLIRNEIPAIVKAAERAPATTTAPSIVMPVVGGASPQAPR